MTLKEMCEQAAWDILNDGDHARATDMIERMAKAFAAKAAVEALTWLKYQDRDPEEAAREAIAAAEKDV